MTEFSPSSYETSPVDWELARRVFGDSFTIPETPPDVYDERRQIAFDAQAAEEEMRQSMLETAQFVGIPLDDAEVNAWRAIEPQQLAQLRTRLKPQQRLLNIMNGLIELEQMALTTTKGVPLRKHQRPFIQNMVHFMLHDTRLTGTIGKGGVIEGPPGIGKTAVFSKIAAAVQYNDEPDDPTRVLVLVPTERIRDQTMGYHGERGFGKFASHLDVGAYPVEQDALERNVTVMCNASFVNLCKKGEMPYYPVVIADEVDTLLGTTTSNYFREYMLNKLVVGLSATTELGGKSVYDLLEHNISRLSMPDAIRAGLLAPMRGFLLKAEPKVDPRTLPTDPTERRQAMARARLDARLDKSRDIIREEVQRGSGVLVRCPRGEDVGVAVDYAAELRDIMINVEGGVLGEVRWVEAEHVGGTTERQTKSERDDILKAFEDGHIDVVTFVKGIGRGYDGPAKALINDDPSTSLTEMIQADGRVSRLSFDDKGNPVEARVYDFEDPSLGSKQRTCLDVLGTKSGELVDHDPDPAAEPRPRKKATFKRAEVVGVEADIVGMTAVMHEVVGMTAVMHEVQVEPPSEAEIMATIEAHKDTEVPFAEACRILGIHPPTMKGILQQLGSNPEGSVKMEDIGTILELYPGLKAAPLPEGEPYLHVTDVTRRITSGYVRTFNFMHFGRSRNFFPQRFTKDGRVGFYYKEAVAERLIAMYEEEQRGRS